MNSTKLILLDVFSYSCMNCLRSLKFIKKIDKKYKKFGLKTTLVHPPEWEFEKDSKNVFYALKKLGIKFPVIIDKNKQLIKKLKVNFWPTQILIKDKKIIYKHIGEGNYKKLEDKIIKSLKIKSKKVFNKEPTYRKYSILYLGKRKGGRIIRLKNRLRLGIVYTTGKWKQKDEYLKSIEDKSYLTALTNGKIINLVAKSINKKPINIGIKSNDKFVKKIAINRPQLYKILKLRVNKKSKLTLMADKNLAVYSFSFQ